MSNYRHLLRRSGLISNHLKISRKQTVLSLNTRYYSSENSGPRSSRIDGQRLMGLAMSLLTMSAAVFYVYPGRTTDSNKIIDSKLKDKIQIHGTAHMAGPDTSIEECTVDTEEKLRSVAQNYQDVPLTILEAVNSMESDLAPIPTDIGEVSAIDDTIVTNHDILNEIESAYKIQPLDGDTLGSVNETLDPDPNHGISGIKGEIQVHSDSVDSIPTDREAETSTDFSNNDPHPTSTTKDSETPIIKDRAIEKSKETIDNGTKTVKKLMEKHEISYDDLVIPGDLSILSPRESIMSDMSTVETRLQDIPKYNSSLDSAINVSHNANEKEEATLLHGSEDNVSLPVKEETISIGIPTTKEKVNGLKANLELERNPKTKSNEFTTEPSESSSLQDITGQHSTSLIEPDLSSKTELVPKKLNGNADAAVREDTKKTSSINDSALAPIAVGSDSTIKERNVKETKSDTSDNQQAPDADENVEAFLAGRVDMAIKDEEASKEDAYNPDTGEINWDCPCLGGMSHGPCGEEFKIAFSCFVYSEKDPKGIDCIERFQNMQNCFKKYPEYYAEQLESKLEVAK
ncbi:hypothetical protein KAFR_0I00540 [Kazachstania africana CBS 2517]|uniref:Mitochondrial intermembrane space import and assembly protein 40 n=1 Tax=Kazachstania africana (strain ATCC 22294 / BCRC 22015 / CBS 2517 / CECT 1963 / NBRC 1671 / NRRL Y-8276) TaxID=1071382 RepID=H2AZN5_KAZAF|nr:hypothetical protein KAFR_0I00540 [Kazachstania africana CBS 2517]CCF59835.1 hypothetical protein KAFR_0I00540 [Kazachstania africana CBS 2517]